MSKLKIVTVAILLMAASCTKDVTKLNTDPKNPAAVPSYSLFTNAQRSLARTVASSNVNLNIFRLIVQYWQEVTYTAESRYNINSRNIPSNLWQALYRDALEDLNEAKKIIPSELKDPDPAVDAAMKKNQLAIIDILQVYDYYYLVTTYGDIPYTQALDINNVFPAFDDQQTVYNDLLTRLDAAITSLDPAYESFGNADIVYGGDVASWQRFANSFKLKMGMTIADVDVDKAKTAVTTAVAAGVFTSNDDNATFNFLSAPPNANPVWEDLVQSGRKDFVAAQTIVDTMTALGDPRLNDYFTLDGSGSYSGSEPGRGTTYSIKSKPSVALTAPDYPVTLMDYSEVEFFLAEAAERGFGVSGTAAQHYNSAVTASILFWGGTAAEATTYLALPAVNYATAPGDWKHKIGVQKWISLYNRTMDPWIEWRRLDSPGLLPAYRATTDIPLRFTYPVNEQNYNTTNYNKAAASIGGDDVTTKLFWDVY